jgi:hypothetical protein
MFTPERTNHPADNSEPGGAVDVEQPCSSVLDDGLGLPFDYIDEAIEESMIASDPPALTPETAIGPPGRHQDEKNQGRS